MKYSVSKYICLLSKFNPCRRYAEAKLTAVSGIFCLGQRVWRNPSVAAAAAALTDTYWGRLEEEKEAAAANPRWG